MKIYVSDDIYEYLTIGKRDIHSGVDDDLVVKSLEQHDKELLKEFADKLLDFIKDKSYVFNGEYSLENFRRNSMYTRTATLIDEIKFLLKERGVE